MSTKRGTLRVWHIPQVPGKAFRIDVSSVQEAAKIMAVLADYDLFQYRNRIKPDYSNASGVEVYAPDLCCPDIDSDGWLEWMDAENGEDLAWNIRNGADVDALVWEGAATQDGALPC